MLAADLFSGLGGFSEGARQAGLPVALAANHSPDAIAWHSRNHPETEHHCQDLMHFDWRHLPDLSDGVLLASPCCQDFSTAGQPAKRGAGGSHAPSAERVLAKHQADRNTSWAVLAALSNARPKVAVIENVVQFQEWRDFPVWLTAVEGMGYAVRVHSLNALDYGGGTDRVRTIITASQAGAIDLDVPHLKPRTIAECLDAPEDCERWWSPIDSKSERMRWRIRKAQDEAGSTCFWNNVSESRGRSLDEHMPTMTTKSGTQFCLVDGDRVRVMNPRELARGMGFPDTYELPKARGLASLLIGNAISVDVSRHVVGQVVAA